LPTLNRCCGSGSVGQPRKALSYVAVNFQVILMLTVPQNHVILAYVFIEMPCMCIIKYLVPRHGLILIMKIHFFGKIQHYSSVVSFMVM
jgi:hypothetical protein